MEVVARVLLHPTRTLRGAMLRLLRYAMREKTAGMMVDEFNRRRLGFLVARSLERYEGLHFERMQAIKVLRKIMQYASDMVDRSMAAALVAVAEHSKDAYSLLAMETLGELTLFNPQLSVDVGGVTAMLMAAVDPAFKPLQKVLIGTVVTLYDNPKTRVFVRPQADLRVVFGPLSDTLLVEATGDRPARWRSAARAVAELCSSWTGTIAVLSDVACLPSLVNSLLLRAPELQFAVLSCFYDVLKLREPKSGDPLRTIRREARLTAVDIGTSSSSVELQSRTLLERPNLLDGYLAMMLVSLIEAGLIPALVEIARASEEPGRYLRGKETAEQREELSSQLRELSMRGTSLLAEVLHLSNALLPTLHCARLQTLPSLMKLAMSFEVEAETRTNASSIVWFLHQYAHFKGTVSASNLATSSALTGANKWRRVKGRDRRLDRIDDVKHKMDVSMDDRQVQLKLQDTQVLLTKDHTKWDWDVISELIEGPLHNLTHLQAALKTKFFKRLLSFLRPSKRVFATLAFTSSNITFVRVACQMFELLLQSDAGAAYLQENLLLKELAELLLQELNSNQATAGNMASWRQSSERNVAGASLEKAFGSTSGGRSGTQTGKDGTGAAFFSQQRVLKTLSREYFTFIGTLSAFQRGLQLLKVFKILSYLRPLMELNGRDDLSNVILTSLGYNLGGAQSPRLLLLSCLESQSRVVRFLASRHMRVLLRSGTNNFSQWGVDFLTKRLLSETDSKVRQLTLAILDEALDNVDCMETLIEQRTGDRPLVDVLPELDRAGEDLLIRILSRPAGFAKLKDTNFLKDAIKRWRTAAVDAYALGLDESLERAFSATSWKKEFKAEVGNGVLFPPPHLYGELAKTEDGCALLAREKLLEGVLDTLYDAKAPADKRRGALWAVGCVGSSETGFRMLEQFKVVEFVAKEARTCQHLSMRGTCFYVLGMLCRTDPGRAKLASLSWESPENGANVCIPVSVKESGIFRIRMYEFMGKWAERADAVTINSYAPDSPDAEAMKLIENISNNILVDSSSKSLKKLAQAGAPSMAKSSVYFDAMSVISIYRYRLPVRRFIYDAFNAANLDFNFWDSQSLKV